MRAEVVADTSLIVGTPESGVFIGGTMVDKQGRRSNPAVVDTGTGATIIHRDALIVGDKVRWGAFLKALKARLRRRSYLG